MKDDNKENLFLKNIIEIYNIDSVNITRLDINNITSSQINDEVFCLKNDNDLFIYLKSNEHFNLAGLARLPKYDYEEFIDVKYITNDLEINLPECDKKSCKFSHLNLHRNILHKVISFKSLSDLQQSALPIWVVKKSNNLISFNVESCFD